MEKGIMYRYVGRKGKTEKHHKDIDVVRVFVNGKKVWEKEDGKEGKKTI